MSDLSTTALPAPRVLTQSERARSLTAAIGGVAIASLGLGLTMPLLALSLEHSGASATFIGFNSAASSVASLVIIPFIPAILRRVDPFWYLMGCLGLAITSVLLFPLVDNVWLWFPIRFLMGLSLYGHWVVSETWINTLAEEDTRGRLIAIYATAFSVGFAAGPILLMITGAEGWLPFATGAAVMTLAGGALSLGHGLLPEMGAPAKQSFLGFIWIAPAIMGAAFIYGAAESGIFSLLPVYAVRTAFTGETAALVLSVFAAGNIVLQYPIGWIADRYSRPALLVVCATCGVLGASLFPFAVSSLYLLLPLIFIWGGLIAGVYTIGLVLLGETFRGPNLAAANAAFIMLYSLGALGGPTLGGVGMDIWNPHGLAVVLAGLFSIYLVIALVNRRPVVST